MRPSTVCATSRRGTRTRGKALITLPTATLVTALLAAVLALSACTTSTAGSGQHSGATSTTPAAPTTSLSTPDTAVPPTSPSISTSAPSSPASSASSSGAGTQASVVITRNGWDASTHTVTVVAIVPGVTVQIGQCTLTLVNGTSTVTATTTATPDATSMDCGSMTSSSPSLTAGTWSATVAFSGDGVSGRSAPVSITVTG